MRIHRTRQVTATVVLATYGSAAAFFASHPTAMWSIRSLGASLHVVSPIILLGILFLLVGWATDRKYYFKLLISSVEVGEKEIERRFDFPAKLTIKLSSSVNRLHAKFTVYLFYFAALSAGILLFLFVNFSTGADYRLTIDFRPGEGVLSDISVLKLRPRFFVRTEVSELPHWVV